MVNVYESCILLKAELDEEGLGRIKTMLADVLADTGGKILLQENWGKRSFAWPLKKNLRKGTFLYTIYSAPGTMNKELTRRLNIDDSVIRSLVVKLGEDGHTSDKIKNYRNPFEPTRPTRSQSSEESSSEESTDKE